MFFLLKQGLKDLFKKRERYGPIIQQNEENRRGQLNLTVLNDKRALYENPR